MNSFHLRDLENDKAFHARPLLPVGKTLNKSASEQILLTESAAEARHGTFSMILKRVKLRVFAKRHRVLLKRAGAENVETLRRLSSCMLEIGDNVTFMVDGEEPTSHQFVLEKCDCDGDNKENAAGPIAITSMSPSQLISPLKRKCRIKSPESDCSLKKIKTEPIEPNSCSMSADFDRGFASDVSIISISSVSSVPEHLEVSSASSVESSDLEDLPPGEEKDAMDAEIQRRLSKAFDADSSSDEENDTNGKDFEISNGLFDEISESSIDKCPGAEDLSRDESDTSVPETSPIAIPPLEHVSFVNEKIKTEHIHPTTSSIPNRISSLPSISSHPMDCKAETDAIFSS
eukprot:55347_1